MPLRILHISDLHERATFKGMPSGRKALLDRNARERNEVLGAKFIEVLRTIVPETGVDLVCLTGDVADWGHPNEYKAATVRLTEILKTVGVPRERLFVVPGNHDVQRKTAEDAWKGLRGWYDSERNGAALGKWLESSGRTPSGIKDCWRKEILKRTKSFWQWAKKAACPDIRQDAYMPLGYRYTFPVGTWTGINAPVHIIGLDSAWLCGNDSDQGHILVTEEQVSAHVQNRKGSLDGFRIALVHHPLEDLADGHKIRGVLASNGVDLLLHGHQHEPRAFAIEESGARLKVLAAGCLMEGDEGRNWPNCFQLIEIDTESRSYTVHFRKWARDAAVKFWAKGSDIYQNAPDGVLRWNDAPVKTGPTIEQADSGSAIIDDLIFNITPGPDTWTVLGPTPGSQPRTISSPLLDTPLIQKIAALRKAASEPIVIDNPKRAEQEAAIRSLAQSIGEQLNRVLLSDGVDAIITQRIHAAGPRGPRLSIRVMGDGPESDQALALPWELLMPKGESFPVQENKFVIVREAVCNGAPSLSEPTEGPLRMVASIAVPEDKTARRHEDEAFRLYQSLAEHQVRFTDLGDLEDLVEAAGDCDPTIIHFSGYGLPGQLVFENEYGLAKCVPVKELMRKLHLALSDQFPKLFFLASCHGASCGQASEIAAISSESCRVLNSSSDLFTKAIDQATGTGPSTAATLHRSGFAQVLGYFGPVNEALCTRAEEEFYGAIARGEKTLRAVTRARDSLQAPIPFGDKEACFPYAWTQLALYHRGNDQPLVKPGTAKTRALPRRKLSRESINVSGLPVLKHGFIGRRSLQHRIRRKVEQEDQRLIVLQGMGGLGKTALACHLVSQVFAKDPADVLILTCKGLGFANDDPALVFWMQAEGHGKDHGISEWDELTKQVRERKPKAAEGFEETVRLLRKARPALVIYADNLETLQAGPKSDGPSELGTWLPQAIPTWQALEHLSEDGLVIVSTRYGWQGLDPKACVPIEPMNRADILRIIETFKCLGALPRNVQLRLAELVDGHPRTIEYLDALVGKRRTRGDIQDAWAELIEPVLPEKTKKIREDLLLDALWNRLSKQAQAHARALTVLRRPAPSQVVDALGTSQTTDELSQAGFLTMFRQQSQGKLENKWAERWGMHSLIVEFVSTKAGSAAGDKNANRAAGLAYKQWVKQKRALWSDQEEGVEHLFQAEEGNQAWPMVQEYVFWLRHNARYREALSLLQRCEPAGVIGGNLANALQLLAQMRILLGDSSVEINNVLDRALSLAESDEMRGSILNEKGSLLADQRSYTEAEELLRQSLTMKAKALGTDHPDYGATLTNLAGVLVYRHKYAEAQELLEESLAILEKTLGADHPDYGAALNTLADLQQRLGNNAEAEELLEKALAIKEKALGTDHPSLIVTLTNLAYVLIKQDRPDEAERYFFRARKMVEREQQDSASGNGPSSHQSCSSPIPAGEPGGSDYSPAGH